MAKSTKSETQTAPAQVAAATPATVVAAKAEKTPKTPKAEKVTAPKAEKVAAPKAEAAAPEAKAAKPAKKAAAPKTKEVAPVVAAPAPAAEGVTEAVAAETSSVTSEFTDFMTKLQQLGGLISSLKTEFRSLEKKASRELKTAAKASHKRKRKTGNRSPSGFVKPTLISDELAAFLGKGKGTQMARTEVTREINAYIRANQLQDKTNGRRINADTNLASLLKLNSGEELTYFNLQRYMSPHFAKSVAAVASA
jgi:upstream activation factor subunit UAF30